MIRRKPALTPMQRYRDRLRSQGLRLLQLWVPDTRSPRFVAEFRRQARLVAAHEAARSGSEAKALTALMESQDTTGWKP